MTRFLPRTAACLLACTALSGQAATTAPSPQFWYDASTPYLSAANIPVGFYGAGGPSLLDTLEDGSLDASLSGSQGGVISPGVFNGARDSVDADDGLIDGSCGPQPSRCASWFHSDGQAGVTFTYLGAGPLPTAFGLVWTDGGGKVTFSATGIAGQSLGSFTVDGTADGSFSSTTAEDRFFGLTFAGGIRSITISNQFGGIELDHLQYGQMAAAVPEPETWALFLMGGLALRLRRRRHPG